MKKPPHTRDERVLQNGEPGHAPAEFQGARLKKARKALRQSQTNYAAIVEAFPGFIYLCSPDYDLTFMNRRFAEHVGRNAVGEKCYQAIHGLDGVCPWCENERVLQGETIQWEVLSPMDHCWYHVLNAPVSHADGSVSKMSVSRDITWRKKMEQDLLQAREELERRVEERTEELSRNNDRLKREVEERKSIEEALRRSEAQYKDLVQLLPQVVYEVDAKENFTFMNCTGLERFGYTCADLARGVSVFDVFVPEDRKRLARNIGKVMGGEKLSGNEYTARQKDGDTFPVLTYSSPIIREDQVAGLRGVLVDMTDLKRAQEMLWIKDSAIACSINAIVMTDLQGRLTYVNPSFLKLWGYDRPREVRGRPAVEFWQPEKKATEIMKALNTTGWWIGELAAKRRDGSSFDTLLSATMVTDETGKPICLMGSFIDLTERKRLSQALQTSEERFRAIFNSARDCIYIKDPSLRYIQVNPAVEKLVGLPASEIIGWKAEDVFGAEAAKRLREVCLRALSGETIEEEHTRSVKGEPLTFHEVTVPLRGAGGQIIGVCTISRNITERMKTRGATRILTRDYPSDAMRATLYKARHAAARDGIVLLYGESGSGKDYVAQWIHNHSMRASGPFFAINCAALPQELAESELFGHEPGAFTGARARKRGLLELAEGGTLLLNEIGELSLILQSKLLTFLDTRSFLRVGGQKQIHINARLMAATHRNLAVEVAEGRFLQSLFYRLNVFAIHVPPLRERREDLPGLVEEILTALASEMQLCETPRIVSSSWNNLAQYHWPGNVRELRNVLERALMLWDKGNLNLIVPELNGAQKEWSHRLTFPSGSSLDTVTDEVVRSLCVEALRRCRGSKKAAASLLRISRGTLYRHMKRVGLAR
ncbi:MAG: sigma 54-interacting transcriptional regulator [Desulfomonile tiedjei]|nr:sigma 54-interacting transcriptional regulator [Desulfomonile tiedjei]